jgi:hypothetical protein
VAAKGQYGPHEDTEVGEMSASTAASRMVGMQKAAFNNAFDTVALVQDQSDSAMKILMNQMPATSKEAAALVEVWTDVFRQRRGFYREAMNAFMDRVEDFYRQPGIHSGASDVGKNGAASQKEVPKAR